MAAWPEMAYRAFQMPGQNRRSLLQLHLPHYLFETAVHVRDAAYPGPILIAVMVASVAASVAIVCDRRVGWLVGIGVSVASCVLYVAQVTTGLPGLPNAWSEPTRLLSVLLAGVFV